MLSNRTEAKNAPWNRGKLVGQKLPLKLRDVFGIRVRLQLQRRTRELALFNLAIDSKLRGCDLIALRVGDLARGGALGSRAQVIQQKTGRVVQFEITEQTRHSVAAWIAKRALSRQDFLFPSRVRLGRRRGVAVFRLRHTLHAPDQGHLNLSADSQRARHPVAAWTLETGKHRQVSGDRNRGCPCHGRGN